jgi:hypothetical protein
MHSVKMRTISNIASACGLSVVFASFILNACGITHISMNDALKAGGFVKIAFLQVDVSCWLQNVYKSV